MQRYARYGNRRILGGIIGALALVASDSGAQAWSYDYGYPYGYFFPGDGLGVRQDVRRLREQMRQQQKQSKKQTRLQQEELLFKIENGVGGEDYRYA